MFPHACVD